MDKNGFLWVGTGEGLNLFNGREVQKFFARDHPPLLYDYINQLVCDSANEVWALTAFGHVTHIDRRRQFRHIGLYSQGRFVPTKSIVQNAAGNVYLFTDSGFFRYRYAGNRPDDADSISSEAFEKVLIANFSSTEVPVFAKWIGISENRMAVHGNAVMYILDLDKRKVERFFPIADLNLLAAYDSVSLLVNAGSIGFSRLNITSGQVVSLTAGLQDQRGQPLQEGVTNAVRVKQGQWMLATNGYGLYLWNEKDHQLINYRHNASNAGTVVNNHLKQLAVAPGGWLFAGGAPNGISYTHIGSAIGTKEMFLDGMGQSYNGFINSIATQNGRLWYLTGSENLIEWNSATDAVRFLNYTEPGSKNKLPVREAYCAAFDGFGRLWFATDGNGLYVLRPEKGTSVLVPGIADSSGVAKYGRINHMEHGPYSRMHISTRSGMIIMDEHALKPVAIYEKLTDSLKGKYCTRSWTDKDEHIWVATVRHGVYRYHIPTGSLVHITTENGLPSNNTYAVYKNEAGRLFIGTEEGLAIREANGKTTVITKELGLLNKRIEATLPDKRNRIWLGNDVGLCCYDPSTGVLRAFDERYGLSVQGFRINSYAAAPDGTLVWGTERGLQYFDPEALYHTPMRVRALVNRFESRNYTTTLTQTEHFDLPAGDNFVSFHFTSVEYSPRLQSFFRYRLTGIDTGWTKVFEQFSARYTLLPAGNYTFQLQVSHNGNDWTNADNSVSIYIGQFWYQHPLAKLGGLGILIIAGWWVWRMMQRRQEKEREEIETEGIINYFASQINSQLNTDELLWDVARNCISRLKFEDCVIYLLDESRQVLVQKAAYGPKGLVDYTIHQPIEIQVGKGIVGTVADTGKPLLIPNTAQDPRYITDDQPRLSELAVPMLIDGKVTGVIDSEHTRKNFFTSNHLRILSTIAVLTANQMQRARAESEKKQAEIETMLNRQQAAEYRLQSLRLQMNPHFLFNALNSIQQMILANEEMVATRYLSRFSKLLRAVLVHSDDEFVSLQKEIDILKLYIDLEAVRFKDSFSYSLTCDKGIDTEEVRIPTLLVQPFVENAIWHGLMHKDGDKRLHIHFAEEGNLIFCTVEDNGVGRKRSEQTKPDGHHAAHQSKGIRVSTERLRKMEQTHGVAGQLRIEDLFHADGSPAGTRVHIIFPT